MKVHVVFKFYVFLSPSCFCVSVFSAGMETDWNLLPWQPSPPRRLPPRPAWYRSPCDSEQTNMQNNIWKTKARTLTDDATVKPPTRLRAPCFSSDVTSAPRLCVFCVNVTTQRSAPHTLMPTWFVKCVHQIPPRRGNYYATERRGLTVKFKLASWLVFTSNMLSSDVHESRKAG